MKVLVVIGLFVVTVVLVLFGMFWLLAATTPDQSHLNEEVPLTVLDVNEETRASSSNRHGYRVGYSYAFAGRTYVDDGFVPLSRWLPAQPLQVCIDPGSPAQHTLHLTPGVRCGTYVGTEQTAIPGQGR